MLEYPIIVAAGGILASLAACKLILQELKTLVVLYKELKATISSESPSPQPPALNQKGSRRRLG